MPHGVDTLPRFSFNIVDMFMPRTVVRKVQTYVFMGKYFIHLLIIHKNRWMIGLLTFLENISASDFEGLNETSQSVAHLCILERSRV